MKYVWIGLLIATVSGFLMWVTNWDPDIMFGCLFIGFSLGFVLADQA